MVAMPALFVAFLRIIVRACIGMQAFGTTWMEISLNVVSNWLMFWTAFPLIHRSIPHSGVRSAGDSIYDKSLTGEPILPSRTEPKSGQILVRGS